LKLQKNKIFAIFAVIFLTISICASMIQYTTAHTPPWQIPTYAFINASPNPVGVGQEVTIVVWLDKTIYRASPENDIRFHNYKLTITAPNGKNETVMWETVTDTTSSTYTLYTPNQVGTYTLTFEYPGQIYTSTTTLPSMIDLGPPSPNEYTNDTYSASSATTILNVQEEPIPNSPTYPLPTEYWTRPIEGQNPNWNKISSNWLGSSSNTFYGFVCYQPDGVAPNSGHIMWTKPIQFGGVVGGSNLGADGETFYSGLSYEGQYSNAMIINGRIYYAIGWQSDSFTRQGFACIDLRTGEQIWQQNYPINPSFAQLVNIDTPNQHGTIPNGFLYAVSGSTWVAYDPLDGNWIFNITNAPIYDDLLAPSPKLTGPNGEILIYKLDATAGWLAMWNSTKAMLAEGLGGQVSSMTWRVYGRTVDGNLGWQWNVTVPSTINNADSVIQYAKCTDIILGSGKIPSIMNTIFTGDQSSSYPYTMWALNLNSSKGTIGSLLWIKTYDPPAGNVSRMMGPADFESRVFTMSDRETRVWYGYNLDDGSPIWGPTTPQGPFDYYGNEGGNNVYGAVAYGKLYTSGYSGVLYCHDLKTGNLLWTYGNGDAGNSTSSGSATVYGRYPLFLDAIADGKLYAYTSEHSPNTPQYKGALQRCLNATTGQDLWTLDSWLCQNAYIADGFLTYLNTYDMQIYTIGKGPSAMTVEAPKTSLELGKSLVISGTVTDICAGTKQAEQVARFPNGVPAVSDKSQSSWMAYIYQQKPRPTDITGVPVSISVVDTNGNYRTIGTVTSNSDGYFTYQWKPDIEGQYTVYASFGGSESYWPSYAVTSFAVDPAPATPTPVPTQAPSAADLYFLPAIIGVVIAIIVVGAVLALLVTKKP
jgi:hypothetical protein